MPAVGAGDSAVVVQNPLPVKAVVSVRGVHYGLLSEGVQFVGGVLRPVDHGHRNIRRLCCLWKSRWVEQRHAGGCPIEGHGHTVGKRGVQHDILHEICGRKVSPSTFAIQINPASVAENFGFGLAAHSIGFIGNAVDEGTGGRIGIHTDQSRIYHSVLVSPGLALGIDKDDSSSLSSSQLRQAGIFGLRFCRIRSIGFRAKYNKAGCSAGRRYHHITFRCINEHSVFTNRHFRHFCFRWGFRRYRRQAC